MTELTYLENSQSFNSTAKVTRIDLMDDDRFAIQLDHTIFYPQGGGQPSDQGMIKKGKSEFKVEEVTYNNGEVNHIGRYQDNNNFRLNLGEEVELAVDGARRTVNTRLHSAGHLIDSALRVLEIEDLVPIKGFHFPEGPYVEYSGNLTDDQERVILQKLEDQINSMISQGFEVQSQMATVKELSKIAVFVPVDLPANKPIRAITVWEEMWLPCGGTHVKNISDIGRVVINKIGRKSGNIRISYEVR